MAGNSQDVTGPLVLAPEMRRLSGLGCMERWLGPAVQRLISLELLLPHFLLEIQDRRCTSGDVRRRDRPSLLQLTRIDGK